MSARNTHRLYIQAIAKPIHSIYGCKFLVWNGRALLAIPDGSSTKADEAVTLRAVRAGLNFAFEDLPLVEAVPLPPMPRWRETRTPCSALQTAERTAAPRCSPEITISPKLL